LWEECRHGWRVRLKLAAYAGLINDRSNEWPGSLCRAIFLSTDESLQSPYLEFSGIAAAMN